jgi:hypothetical protein
MPGLTYSVFLLIVGGLFMSRGWAIVNYYRDPLSLFMRLLICFVGVSIVGYDLGAETILAT